MGPRVNLAQQKKPQEPPVEPPHTKERPNLHLGKDRCHEVEIFIAPIVCDHHIGRTITTSRQHGRIGRGVFRNAGFPESCGWLIGSSTQNTAQIHQNSPTRNTVDGRNPANQLIGGRLSHLFAGFYTSQVMQDFFHQQYHHINAKQFIAAQHVQEVSFVRVQIQSSTSNNK